MNDNGGRGGFDFFDATITKRASAGQGAYAISPENERYNDQYVKINTAQSWRVALLSKRQTDILSVGINEFPQGVYADPQTVEGRAAWYSFAFWLRIAAATHLDVDTQELAAGFRTLMKDGIVASEAFLCDQLENGAGYCNYLGRVEQFQKLLTQGDSDSENMLAWQWMRFKHAHECDTSCNFCMRDYSNMSYHPLLDWRLALDMAWLATGTMSIDLASQWGQTENPWQHLVTGAIPRLMRNLRFGERRPIGPLWGYMHIDRPVALIEVHPLWQEEHPLVAEARAFIPQTKDNIEVRLMNPFRALRRPADYI